MPSGQFQGVYVGENLLMPVDLGLQAHSGVVDYEVVCASSIGGLAVWVVFDSRGSCLEGGQAVFEVATEESAVEVCADYQGQIYWVGADVYFGEGFVSEGA